MDIENRQDSLFMADTFKTFGEWWENHVTEKEFKNLFQLSNAIGVNTPQLYKIRNNEKPLSTLMAFRIEKLTGINAEDQLNKQTEYKLKELEKSHKRKRLFRKPRKPKS
jgi:plasmid maintenance system antidote protein VapI